MNLLEMRALISWPEDRIRITFCRIRNCCKFLFEWLTQRNWRFFSKWALSSLEILRRIEVRRIFSFLVATAVHFGCNCPAFGQSRLSTLDSNTYVTTEEIIKRWDRFWTLSKRLIGIMLARVIFFSLYRVS